MILVIVVIVAFSSLNVLATSTLPNLAKTKPNTPECKEYPCLDDKKEIETSTPAEKGASPKPCKVAVSLQSKSQQQEDGVQDCGIATIGKSDVQQVMSSTVSSATASPLPSSFSTAISTTATTPMVTNVPNTTVSQIPNFPSVFDTSKIGESAIDNSVLPTLLTPLESRILLSGGFTRELLLRKVTQRQLNYLNRIGQKFGILS